MHTITITDLDLWTHIGVPQEERSAEQRILATITMQCEGGVGRTDDIEDTVNYDDVCKAVRAIATKEHKTLEKFSEEIASEVLKNGAKHVGVTLKKFVLPDAKHVSVTIERP